MLAVAVGPLGPGGPEVLAGGEDRRRDRQCLEVCEQGAQRRLGDEAVPGGAGRGAEQHGDTRQGAVRDDVHEALEQTRVRGLEHRGDHDHAVGPRQRVDDGLELCRDRAAHTGQGDVRGERAQGDHLHVGQAGVRSQGDAGGLGQAFGKHGGGRRRAQARVDGDDPGEPAHLGVVVGVGALAVLTGGQGCGGRDASVLGHVRSSPSGP